MTDLLELVKNFGLPMALLLAAVGYLVRQVNAILEGKLMVPRWIYDQEVARGDALELKLDRAIGLLERATDEVAAPAVKKAAQR